MTGQWRNQVGKHAAVRLMRNRVNSQRKLLLVLLLLSAAACCVL